VTGLRGCSDGRTTRSRSVRDLAVPTCPYPFGFPFPNASSGNGPFTNAAYQIGASWTAYLYRHRHHDRALGFIHGTSHGLQPWTRYELTNGGESLTVESLPAVHAYGVLGKLLPPVMGSLLVHRVAGAVRRRVYISGDTLTGEHLDEIRERHPEIDTAVVHLGVRAYCSGPSRWTPIKAWTFCNGSGPIWRFRCITTTTESSALAVGILSAMKRDLSGQLLKAPARGETVLLGER
jgi:hypothetical protein